MWTFKFNTKIKHSMTTYVFCSVKFLHSSPQFVLLLKYILVLSLLTICLVDWVIVEEVALAILVVECGPLLDVLHKGGDQGVHLHNTIARLKFKTINIIRIRETIFKPLIYDRKKGWRNFEVLTTPGKTTICSETLRTWSVLFYLLICSTYFKTLLSLAFL